MKKAALILRESVLKFMEEATPLPWPPTIETLDLREETIP